jgi:hypothetical protein
MAPQGVGEAVEAIADDAVDPFHAGGCERLGHLVGDSPCHASLPLSCPAQVGRTDGIELPA